MKGMTRTARPDDTAPTAPCPRCGAEVEDYDGFGVLAHVQPYHADGCGYCSHPSRDGDGMGGMVCGICGDVRREVSDA